MNNLASLALAASISTNPQIGLDSSASEAEILTSPHSHTVSSYVRPAHKFDELFNIASIDSVQSPISVAPDTVASAPVRVKSASQKLDSFFEVGLLGAYSLDYLLPRWDVDDFLSYVREPWPAGMGFVVQGQHKGYHAKLAVFDSKTAKRLTGDLFNFHGHFSEHFTHTENFQFPYGIGVVLNGDVRVGGRWELEGGGKTLSVGKVFPVHQGRVVGVPYELSFVGKLDSFEYDVQAKAHGSMRGNGTVCFTRDGSVLAEHDLEDRMDYQVIADIDGQGSTILLGPRLTLSHKPVSVYATALVELISESQMYRFRIMGEELVLPNDFQVGRHYRSASIGFDIGLLVDLFMDYQLHLNVNGDAGLTHMAKLGLRKNF